MGEAHGGQGREAPAPRFILNKLFPLRLAPPPLSTSSNSRIVGGKRRRAPQTRCICESNEALMGVQLEFIHRCECSQCGILHVCQINVRLRGRVRDLHLLVVQLSSVGSVLYTEARHTASSLYIHITSSWL